jgi:predicted nucleotide-binding protein
MFIGKLTRRRAFLIHPRNLNLKILSDFEGIVKGSYDPSTGNLKAALGPVCDQIADCIKKENITEQRLP